MKKLSLKIKILVGCLLTFLLILSGTFFYISKKISPEQVKKQILESLEQTFPNADVELASFQYSLGLSVSFYLKDLKLHLKKDHSPLLDLGSVDIAIPLWTILMKGGTISLDVNNPKVFYKAMGEKENNWTSALGKKKDEEKKEVMDQSKKVTIINFFANSHINIKVLDLNLHYNLKDDKKGEVFISKFLIKNLNLKTPTAFELASKMEIEVQKNNLLSCESLIIGQVNINEIILDQDLKSSILFKLENIALSSLKNKLPSLKSEINLVIKKQNGELLLTQSSDLENTGHINFKAKMDKSLLLVHDIDIQLYIKELLKTFAPDKKNITADKTKFFVKGQFEMQGGHKTPHFQFGLAPALGVALTPDMDLSTTVSGLFEEKRLQFEAQSDLLTGKIETAYSTTFDLNAIPKSLSAFSLGHLKISLHDFVVSEKALQEALYAKSGEKTQEMGKATVVASSSSSSSASSPQSPSASSTPSASSSSSSSLFPPMEVNLSWEKIGIGKELFTGRSRLHLEGESVTSKETHFQFSQGQGAISFFLQLLPREKKAHWDFSLNGLNLSSLKPFLPPKIDLVTGTFTGKVKGESVTPVVGSSTFAVDYQLEAKKGQIVGIDIGELIQKVGEKVPFLKGQMGHQKVDNNFESLKMKGFAKHNSYFIEYFYFSGLNKKVEMEGKGLLYPVAEDRLGMIDVNLMDHSGTISPFLERNTGHNLLPMRFQGKGMNLTPDYNYTLTELAKKALKKKSDKLVEKGKNSLKEGIEKEVQKVIPLDEEGKKGVKKLLNGLFK